MRILAIIVALIALVAMVAGGFVYVVSIGEDKCKLAQAEKDRALAEMQRQWAASEQARLDVEKTARAEGDAKFRDGLAKGRARARQTEIKGAADVADKTNHAVLSDPRCVLPDDSLRNLRAAFAGPAGDMRPATDAARPDRAAGVPAAPDTGGRQFRVGVSSGYRGGEPVLGVQEQARPPSGAGETGRGVLRTQPPKPKPIGRAGG
jgi:hypothetical protein